MAPDTFWQLISIATFFIGVLVGHWLAIGRDKRNDFNALAPQLAIKVGRHQNFIGDEVVFALRICPWNIKRRLRKAIDRYLSAKAEYQPQGQDPVTGELLYPESNLPALQDAARDLVDILGRR